MILGIIHCELSFCTELQYLKVVYEGQNHHSHYHPSLHHSPVNCRVIDWDPL